MAAGVAVAVAVAAVAAVAAAGVCVAGVAGCAVLGGGGLLLVVCARSRWQVVSWGWGCVLGEWGEIEGMIGLGES